MEFEFLGIFQVKVAAKNILLGSLGTQHHAVFAMWCLFLKKQIFWTKLLHLSVFPVKQYTSLIYVKKKSFCLINWAFTFVGPWGPISCSKVANISYAYEC